MNFDQEFLKQKIHEESFGLDDTHDREQLEKEFEDFDFDNF